MVGKIDFAHIHHDVEEKEKKHQSHPQAIFHNLTTNERCYLRSAGWFNFPLLQMGETDIGNFEINTPLERKTDQ